MSRRAKIILAVIVFIVALQAVRFARGRCVSAWLTYGVTIGECPDGEVHPHLSVNASGLRRGTAGEVSITAAMLYTTEGRVDVQQAPLAELDGLELSFVRKDRPGEITALTLDEKDYDKSARGSIGRVTLPETLKDGDYLLRAKARTKAGNATLDVPLAIYAPGKVHLITDRPLYEPGNTIKMRAVMLRARDLVPLEDRPGRFTVIDPQGVTVLDEAVTTGAFGITDAEIPLDKSAPEGAWRIRYQSGDASDEQIVDVRPFTLPRFTVTVESVKPYYRAKDEPKLRARVAFASGVPISGPITIEWRVDGAWPPPTEWLAALPKTARTDKSGVAELAIPRVPADLVGKVTVRATVTADDGSGDQEVGAGTALLAQDPIDVSLLTDLGDQGLVDGINNRAYLRVTTAAGMPLTNATLTVKRAWDKKDKGKETTTDEDGVALLQIDPGPASNIVIPPLPVRLPPPPPPVERTGVSEIFSGGEPTLAETAAMDRWNPLIAGCARLTSEDAPVELTIRVDSNGSVRRFAATDDAARCVGNALVGKQLPAGGARAFHLSYVLRAPLAFLSFDAAGAEMPVQQARAIEDALMDARTCVGRMTAAKQFPRVLAWDVIGGVFSASFEKDNERVDDPLDADRARCIEGKLANAMRTVRITPARASGMLGALGGPDEDEEESAPRFGVGRITVDPVVNPDAPQRTVATTMLGYELLVHAKSGDEDVGSTTLRVTPGALPPLRLRATPVIAEAGGKVTIEILRGPDYTAELPKKLWLTSTESSIEADVDLKARTAVFTLPKDKDGWYEARVDNAIARVFVPRSESLRVEVKSDKPSYRPGEMAKLAVTTKERDAGVAAAVGLIGVDDTLATLAALPGPDAMDRLAPTATMTRPAFGVLDAAALALGRVRGKNAQAATVLLVSTLPVPSELDVAISGYASTTFEPTLPLADRFFTILEHLYKEVRAFESSAGKDEKLTPEKMVALWSKALDATKKNGKPITDVFGRRIDLHLLPDHLLALTEPRVMVADGTRLPEDIEAWIPFVRRSHS